MMEQSKKVTGGNGTISEIEEWKLEGNKLEFSIVDTSKRKNFPAKFGWEYNYRARPSDVSFPQKYTFTGK